MVYAKIHTYNENQQCIAASLAPQDGMAEFDVPNEDWLAIVDGEIVALEPELPVPILKTQFTSLEYLDRFTDAEQLAVVSATLQSAQVKLWYDRLLAASYIDLNDPRTEGGIDALIANGLIAADRKASLMEPEPV